MTTEPQPERIVAKVVPLAPIAMNTTMAALYIGVSTSTIYEAIYHEHLPAVRIGVKGGRWSILVEDLKAYRLSFGGAMPNGGVGGREIESDR